MLTHSFECLGFGSSIQRDSLPAADTHQTSTKSCHCPDSQRSPWSIDLAPAIVVVMTRVKSLANELNRNPHNPSRSSRKSTRNALMFSQASVSELSPWDKESGLQIGRKAKALGLVCASTVLASFAVINRLGPLLYFWLKYTILRLL